MLCEKEEHVDFRKVLEEYSWLPCSLITRSKCILSISWSTFDENKEILSYWQWRISTVPLWCHQSCWQPYSQFVFITLSKEGRIELFLLFCSNNLKKYSSISCTFEYIPVVCEQLLWVGDGKAWIDAHWLVKVNNGLVYAVYQQMNLAPGKVKST
jgi:hypothetical protein